jgi:hypothetical protein
MISDGAVPMITTADPNGVTVLDHVDNIIVPGKVFAPPVNEYWALVCLRDGMEFLYRQALRLEQVVKQRLNPAGNLHVFHMGNLRDCPDVPITLLTCGFHWYAISACQYVRAVGAIAVQHDPSRPLPRVYAQQVIPEVVAFRDKVAAHLVGLTKNKRDNDAERLASLLPALTFEDDSWYVGGFTLALSGGDKAVTSQAIKRWSLCRVHEQLRKRYWPLTQPGLDPSSEAGT